MKKAMTAAVLCALALAGMARARDDAAAEKLGWKLGLQCWTFRQLTFFETVDRAKQMGLKYIEAYPGQTLKPGSDAKTGPEMSAEDIAATKAKLSEAGVKWASFGVSGIPTDEAAARKHFTWAKAMGIEVLVTETKPTPLLDKLSGEFGIGIALHNHPNSWPPEEVLAACEGMSNRVGSCADTGHWKRRGLDPLETLRKLKGRVVSMHLKDVAKPAGKDGYDDQPWGAGECNAKGMLEEMRRQGFKGYVMIEYEVGSVDDLMQNVPKCVAFFDLAAAGLAK